MTSDPTLRRQRRNSAVGLLSIALVAGTTLFRIDPATAHDGSVSYSTWRIDQHEARATLQMTALDLSRLTPSGNPMDPALGNYWVERLALLADGKPCGVIEPPRTLTAPSGKVALEWRLDCGPSEPDEIRSHLFLDEAPGHLHFAKIRQPGTGLIERVLSAPEPSWQIDAGDQPSGSIGSSLRSYVVLGVEHILTGYDHLVFLFALLLLASRFRELATIVTGFTVAHSLTLGLAVIEGLRPDSNSVEALIGLSIALVAAENAWLLAGRPRIVPIAIAMCMASMTALGVLDVGSFSPVIPAGLCVFALCYFGILARVDRPVRLRIAISFVFGLVHGFGFAGVLEEIELPANRLASALFGFNLGVEVGQLVIISLVWPALRGLSLVAHGRPHRWLLELGTATTCALGVFWLVERAYL